MHAPYTDHPTTAFAAAQYGAGVLLTLLSTPLRRAGRWVHALWLMGLWTVVVSPVIAEVVVGFDLVRQSKSMTVEGSVRWIALALWLACLGVSGRKWATFFGCVALIAAGAANHLLVASNWDVLVTHLCCAGLLWALLVQPSDRFSGAPRLTLPTGAATRQTGKADWSQDLILFGLGFALGAVVCDKVLFRGVDGSDEWGYTYQAAVLARGKFYGTKPPCIESIRNYWLFWRDNRMFAQYQIGWPLFLTPFMALDMIWLGGPCAFGIFCVAMARLTRLVMRSVPSLRATAHVGAWLAAGSMLISSSMLVNGGARFPHQLNAALFLFSIEVTLLLGEARSARRAAKLGAVLGALAGCLLLIRVPDAVLLSIGPLLYLVISTLRKRTHWIVWIASITAFVPLAVLLLWSAHVQVGGWGVLPYMIAKEFHSYVQVRFSFPKIEHWKWALPLGWASYCFWPSTPALGAAGFVLALRQRALWKLGFTLGLSWLASTLFYFLIEFGRGGDFGYGPRYHMISVVPMALGLALVFGYTVVHLKRSRTLVVGLACIVPAIVIATEMLPSTYRLLARASVLDRLAQDSGVRNAVAIAKTGSAGYPYGAYDLTHNLPIELYSPNVILANDRELACLRREYPLRDFYLVKGTTRAPELVPLEETEAK